MTFIEGLISSLQHFYSHPLRSFLITLGMIIGVVTFGIMPRFQKAKKKTTLMQLNKIAELIRENSMEPEYTGKPAKTIFDGLVSDGTIKRKMTKDNYGQEIRVNFIQRIRDEIKFSSIDALSRQITEDVVTARSILS